MNLYPLVFHPRFKERIWGSESWTIADRPGDESVVANGPLAGRSLHDLMQSHSAELLGSAAPAAGNRFPLLCKILDARERLSLQVHPRDTRLGDPKTEMWYIAQADPGAALHVGLKRGVTRALFESSIREGRVADCFHRIPVAAGDAMFLPSGRVHAIGAGLVIFEIQQNSDTTFRVFDWNRLGLDGKPREVHVAQSLESIDFDDVEPALIGRDSTQSGPFTIRPLVRHALFDVDLVSSRARDLMRLPPARLRVIAVVAGTIVVSGGGVAQSLDRGQFCLWPAALTDATIAVNAEASFLLAEPH